MFTLPFDIPENPKKLTIEEPVFSIGSCFADRIGAKLADHKFDVTSNPFGIIYNPHSIFKNISQLLSHGLDPDNIVQNGGVYYHWDTHSTLSHTDLSTFRQLLDAKSIELKNSLLKSKWMVMTLGTAYVYQYLPTGNVVANCHKIPGKEFNQYFLTSAEIVEEYLRTMELVRTFNPDVNVILSVSPVRHVRDGLVKNNVSKAILLQATDEITKKDKNSHYFPAYELVIDVLRDYRFYEADMIHPNAQAVDYVWDRFIETYMNKETQDFISQWGKIRKSLAHKPFHPASPEHQAFLRSTIKQLQTLKSKIDISSELRELENQLV